MPIIDSRRTDYLFGSTKTKLEVHVTKDLAYLLCEPKLPDKSTRELFQLYYQMLLDYV